MNRKTLSIILAKFLLFIPLCIVCRSPLAATFSHSYDHTLDFYGTIIARRFISHDLADDGDRSYLYFGLKGNKRLNPEWQAYGQWEYTVSASDASRNATRLAFMGLKNQSLGQIDIGRNWGVLYDVTSLTDRSPLFREMSYNYIDNFMRGRALNLITYRKSLNVVSRTIKLTLQYQLPGNQPSTPAMKQNGQGFGASLSYSLTPYFDAIIASSSSEATRTQYETQHFQQHINTLAAGLKYQSPKVYLAAISTQSNNTIHPESDMNNHASSSYEILGKYMLTEHFQPEIGYTRLMQTVDRHRQSLLNYEEIGFSYFLNKSMQIFVDYKINNIKKNPSRIDSSDKLDVGLSYHW
ncbi:porin [Klebsiella aerogenes]|uniref:porin n=1 Tax=Klebsiella aerogenes TaxID=548 RepID=UPI00186746C5|nr:porin [Klebsiella aerogenes]